MIRALGILATIVALAVSAAPVASANTSKKPPSPTFLDQPQPTTSFKPKAGPSKAPRLSSRSGGEVISADAYVRAPRTVVTEEIGTTH